MTRADADGHDPLGKPEISSPKTDMEEDFSGPLTGIPGQVVCTRGTHDTHEMSNIGLPAPKLLEWATKGISLPVQPAGVDLKRR